MAASFMARVVLILVLSLWLLPSLLPGSLAAGASSAGNELLPLSGGSSRRMAMVRSRERKDGYGLSIAKSARRSLRLTPGYEHNPGDGPRETPVTPIERNKQPGN
ncbi:hypothetical protein DAI22_02g087600 [Oryza sativa Japonica Group]|nr:hypothetical protein DAI22_02g087600 [Oryza sativa Japonica Group]